jgi:hypothetical protein
VKILDPRFAPPAAPPGGALVILGLDGFDDANSDNRCWPDYIIRATPGN